MTDPFVKGSMGFYNRINEKSRTQDMESRQLAATQDIVVRTGFRLLPE